MGWYLQTLVLCLALVLELVGTDYKPFVYLKFCLKSVFRKGDLANVFVIAFTTLFYHLCINPISENPPSEIPPQVPIFWYFCLFKPLTYLP